MSDQPGPVGQTDNPTGKKRLIIAAALCLIVSTGVAWFVPTQSPKPRTIRPRVAPFAGAALNLKQETHQGPLPALTPTEIEVGQQLKAYVQTLASEIGERNAVRARKQLNQAADFIESEWTTAGYQVARQKFRVTDFDCFNLDCEIPGTTHPKEIVVVGAHYDTVVDCPGANDNGSGVAALLVLANRLVATQPARTLRFVAFTNEEQPYSMSSEMGSLVYARAAKAKQENIVAMLSLETIGYYTDVLGTQKYIMPLDPPIPDRGDYIAFATRSQKRDSALLERCMDTFRKHTQFPSDARAMPQSLPGVGWSDHWSFWQCQYPAIIISDTAPFRYPYYHRRTDTPDKLVYDRMARVVVGLQIVIEDLAGIATPPANILPPEEPKAPEEPKTTE